MTPQEREKKLQEKIQAIRKFCEQLEIVMAPKQMIMKDMTISTVIMYTDNEKYPEDTIKEEQK